MDNVFFFFAGVGVLLLIQYLTRPARTITHEYDDGVTRIVVQDFCHEEVARTTVYGTDGAALFKRSWVGKHLCYSPLPTYFQEGDTEVGTK